MKKIIILILSCYDSIYQKLAIDGIDKTWNSIEYPNTNTFYYYGNSSRCYHDNKNIYVTSQDSYNHIAEKTFETFEYCLNNFNFDYIFRTNSSSYINKKALFNWLQDKPSTNFYSGVIGHHKNIKFASGCGYTLSRDLVQKSILEKQNINNDQNLPDDVYLSKLLYNIPIIPAPRQDPLCMLYTDYDVNNNFHFRCKCEQDRNMDIQHMYNIHNKILNHEKI